MLPSKFHWPHCSIDHCNSASGDPQSAAWTSYIGHIAASTTATRLSTSWCWRISLTLATLQHRPLQPITHTISGRRIGAYIGHIAASTTATPASDQGRSP